MPKIGEFKRGHELGKTNTTKDSLFIWQACEKCGKERWVVTRNRIAISFRCNRCAMREHKLSEQAKINIGNAAKNRCGEKSYFWKRGYWIALDGYLAKSISKDHPYRKMASSCGIIKIHRLVMAEHLDRCLLPTEHVHHKNGNKLDNRIENLEGTANSQHIKDHHKGYTDGYSKGLIDGHEQRIKELESRVTQLEAENILLKSQNVLELESNS